MKSAGGEHARRAETGSPDLSKPRGERGRGSDPRPRRILRSLYRLALRLRLRFLPPEMDKVRVRQVSGRQIIILPGVFDGVLLRTGAFLAETLDGDTVPPDAHVLDLGTGSGIGAVFAARWASQVIATDINPDAVRCVRLNALANYLDDRIEARLGDLFDPVEKERFDLILFNPPYYRAVPRSLADSAWRSPDAFDRFLCELPQHLAENGRARLVLSTDADITEALEMAPGLSMRVVREQDFVNETLRVYEVRVKE